MMPSQAIPSDTSFDGSLPRSFLRSALHLALMPGPSHGYDLLEQLRAFGLTSVDLAGVYRALRSMDRENLVSSSWEDSELGPPRRVYQLTDTGFRAADAHVAGLRSARNHLDSLLASVGADNPLSVTNPLSAR
jgi:PadR family transcriptional regulator, regulatory protein PadR